MQLAIDGSDHWNLLSDILPFFGAELPYSRAIGRMSLHLSPRKIERLENLHDDLFMETGFIKLNIRPEHELTPEEFAECMSSIDAILVVLDALLNDQIRLFIESESQTFTKLRALQNHLQYAQNVDVDFDTLDREFGGLVRFYHDEGGYKRSIQLVERCNRLFEDLFKEEKRTTSYDIYNTGLPMPWKKDPNFEMRDFACTLFELLTDKWPLRCYKSDRQESHQAKLNLNTWQASRISRKYAEFDMIFSTHGKPFAWQESTITISDRSRRPTFIEPHERNLQVRGAPQIDDGQKMGASLCSMLNKPGRRDMPPFDNGKVWQISLIFRSQDTAFRNQPISLQMLLEEATALHTLDKRVLGVIIGHSFLHLCESPWLHQRWGKGDILFFPRTSESVIDICKPFVSPSLSSNVASDIKDDAYCPHEYPSILALGILLLEIELGQTIASVRTAEDGKHSFSSLDTDRRTASRIIQSSSFKKSVHVGYRIAIEACLECRFMLPGMLVTDVDCRSAIYDNIIAPIEKELWDGWEVVVDDPKTMVSAFPSTIVIPPTIIQPVPPIHEVIVSQVRSVDTLSRGSGLYHERNGLEQLTTTVPREIAVLGPPLARSFLVDDEPATDPEKIRRSNKWFGYLDRFLEVIFFPVIDKAEISSPGSSQNVKIAILDTGIDFENTVVKANRERIINVRNWVKDDNGMKDVYGHGAHTVALLLKVAPCAQVCVARIAQGREFSGEDDIVQAIEWAVTDCGADIVTMSFGMSERTPKIRTAINSYGGKKIFFAATHNDGGNRDIAYPAKLSKVIAINSTDGYGNSSDFNPSTKGQSSFSTLGEGIPSEWLGSRDVRKSGTSYATPIAAAISATFLTYAKLKMELESDDSENLHSCEGMRAMLGLMSTPMGGYNYVTPWSLWDGKRSESMVLALIRNELDKLD